MGKVTLQCSRMDWNMLGVAPVALASSSAPKASSVCQQFRSGFESWLPRCQLGDLGAGDKFFFFFLKGKMRRLGSELFRKPEAVPSQVLTPTSGAV